MELELLLRAFFAGLGIACVAAIALCARSFRREPSSRQHMIFIIVLCVLIIILSSGVVFHEGQL